MKRKFKIGDVVQVTDGDYKDLLFRVVKINRSHPTLELIECVSLKTGFIYNFDNLCADVVLRKGKHDLDYILENFYIIKK